MKLTLKGNSRLKKTVCSLKLPLHQLLKQIEPTTDSVHSNLMLTNLNTTLFISLVNHRPIKQQFSRLSKADFTSRTSNGTIKPQSSSSADTFSALFWHSGSFCFCWCRSWQRQNGMLGTREERGDDGRNQKNGTKRGFKFRFHPVFKPSLLSTFALFSTKTQIPVEIFQISNRRKSVRTHFFFMAFSTFGFFFLAGCSTNDVFQLNQQHYWFLEMTSWNPTRVLGYILYLKWCKLNCLLICASLIPLNSIKNPRNEKWFIHDPNKQMTASFRSLYVKNGSNLILICNLSDSCGQEVSLCFDKCAVKKLFWSKPNGHSLITRSRLACNNSAFV